MSGLERCWAQEVSTCSEEISREHYFAPGLFPDVHVSVQGASPLPDVQRDTQDGPVTQVLCKKHEAELAPLDTALIDLVNAIREIERLRAVRSKVSKNWPAHRLTVDGLGVERCVLKMVMSHAVVQRSALHDWRPPHWLPSVIFGGESLKSGCGLAVVVRIGDVIVDRERIGFTFGRSEGTGPCESVVLELRQGLRLVCTWDTPVHSLGELRFQGNRYAAASDALLHPRRVSFANGALDLGVSLDFDWSGKWTGNKHPAVAALREKTAPQASKS